jgi:hypothetical protein
MLFRCTNLVRQPNRLGTWGWYPWQLDTIPLIKKLLSMDLLVTYLQSIDIHILLIA